MRELIYKILMRFNTVDFTYWKTSHLSKLSDQELLDELIYAIKEEQYWKGYADGEDYAMSK